MSHKALSPYSDWTNILESHIPYTEWTNIPHGLIPTLTLIRTAKAPDHTPGHQYHTDRVGSVRAPYSFHPALTEHADTPPLCSSSLHLTQHTEKQKTKQKDFLDFTDYHNGQEICAKVDAFPVESRTRMKGTTILGPTCS